MNSKFYSAILVAMLCVSVHVQAQTIKGDILDNTNDEPLIGASIVLKDNPSNF